MKEIYGDYYFLFSRFYLDSEFTHNWIAVSLSTSYEGTSTRTDCIGNLIRKQAYLFKKTAWSIGYIKLHIHTNGGNCMCPVLQVDLFLRYNCCPIKYSTMPGKCPTCIVLESNCRWDLKWNTVNSTKSKIYLYFRV